MNTNQEIIRKNHPLWEFPDFEIREFKNKQNKYALCVFVINEGEKIRKQIKELKEYADRVDVIIADGGSTDGSLDDNYVQKNKIRATLIKKGPGKLSAQMRMAFAWCLQEGYEGIIVVDGNGKDDLRGIPLFIDALDNGFDHIQGSRFIPGGHAVNTPLERYMAVRLIHSPLISLSAHHWHTDTTNGFRAYSKALLEDKKLNIFRSVFNSYELHYYLAIESARAKNYKLTEVPVTREYPKGVKTPTKISPIKGNIAVIKILLKSVFRRFRVR